MKLSQLIKNLPTVSVIGKTDIEIKDVTADSNSITRDSLFICIDGNNFDGHNFIKQAELYGATAVVCEKQVDTILTQIIVENSRTAMSEIASAFYYNVDKKLKIIGVVGTNGKTTTSHIIYNILNSSGINCGLIGTLGAFYNDKFVEANLTTPDPLELHKLFFEMYSNDVKTVVMEVSAHAIYLDKIFNVNFEIGVFTNFSQDHLDFFGDMKTYMDAKLKFFSGNKCRYVVTNSDDELGRIVSKSKGEIVTYGINNPADTFAIDVLSHGEYYSFVVNLFDCIYDVKLFLKGEFNIYNALAAITTCCLIGVDVKTTLKGLEKINNVAGRLECVYSKEYSVYVDYAHTPDGLKKVIETLKKECDGNLICLFGCGGNRDSSKRSLMGEISGELSDFTIITSDNPRFEEPMSIIRAIESGVIKKSRKYVMIQDRTEAIKYAVSLAKKGDIILVAGKGAENYQDVLGIKTPYSDKITIEEVIRGN